MPGLRVPCPLMAPLVAARVVRGITQSEMASKMGVSQPHVSNIEHGVVSPRVDDLSRYAEVLGIKLNMTFDPYDNLEY